MISRSSWISILESIMFFLAIDIGGTYIKTALLNPERLQITRVLRSPTPGFTSNQNRQHKEISITELSQVLNRQLKNYNDVKISGQVLTHQMHGFVLVDKSGKARSQYISWQDKRGVSTHDELLHQLGLERLNDSGRELKFGYPLSTLFAMKKSGESLTSLTPITLSEWFTSELTGQPFLSIDLTNASAFGGFNLKSKNWNFDLQKELGLAELNWPKVSNDFASIEHNNQRIYLSQGDQQIALAGSFLHDENRLTLNIATGSQCVQLMNALSFGEYQTRPYLGDSWLKTITHIPAGRAMNRLFEFFADVVGVQSLSESVFERLENLAAQVTGAAPEVSLGFFDGAYGSKGEIQNLSEDSMNGANFYRACMRSIAANHFNASSILDKNQSWKEFFIIGGLGQKSKVLQSELKDLFQLEIKHPIYSEDTLVGLFIKAWMIESNSDQWLQAIKTNSNYGIELN